MQLIVWDGSKSTVVKNNGIIDKLLEKEKRRSGSVYGDRMPPLILRNKERVLGPGENGETNNVLVQEGQEERRGRKLG